MIFGRIAGAIAAARASRWAYENRLKEQQMEALNNRRRSGPMGDLRRTITDEEYAPLEQLTKPPLSPLPKGITPARVFHVEGSSEFFETVAAAQAYLDKLELERFLEKELEYQTADELMRWFKESKETRAEFRQLFSKAFPSE